VDSENSCADSADSARLNAVSRTRWSREAPVWVSTTEAKASPVASITDMR
jgi:hypothetical protein